MGDGLGGVGLRVLDFGLWVLDVGFWVFISGFGFGLRLDKRPGGPSGALLLEAVFGCRPPEAPGGPCGGAVVLSLLLTCESLGSSADLPAWAVRMVQGHPVLPLIGSPFPLAIDQTLLIRLFPRVRLPNFRRSSGIGVESLHPPFFLVVNVLWTFFSLSKAMWMWGSCSLLVLACPPVSLSSFIILLQVSLNMCFYLFSSDFVMGLNRHNTTEAHHRRDK